MASESQAHLWKDILKDAQGNITSETKDKLIDFLSVLTREGDFANSVLQNLKGVELAVSESEYGKPQARVVFQVKVHPDMVNSYDTIHGACIAYLVDLCSSIALAVLGLTTNRSLEYVSQAINTMHHAGALLGADLQVVNVTTFSGSRTASARTEILNVKDRRIVASGTHLKMRPNKTKYKL